MKFAKWVKIPGGITPGGTPRYACSACGGSEHLYGVEYPKRKMVCDQCGCVNSYPWEKILDEESEIMDRWVPVKERLPADKTACLICGINGGMRVARAHVATPVGNVPRNCWWTFLGVQPLKTIDVTPVYWMPLPGKPAGIKEYGFIKKKENNDETSGDNSKD